MSVPIERAASFVLGPWQLDRILTHIDANIAHTLRNDALAKLIFLSTSHFSRAFSGSAGMSPARYVMRRRIEFACRLMIGTKMTLCQIAIAAGLCDQAHFCRTFRRFFFQTPRSWRHANAHSAHDDARLRENPLTASVESAQALVRGNAAYSVNG